MSEIAKKKDSLKSKKHTFLLIVKISVITINICLWCVYILLELPHLRLEHFMNGRIFQVMANILLGVPIMIFEYTFGYIYIPVYQLFMSFMYVY